MSALVIAACGCVVLWGALAAYQQYRQAMAYREISRKLATELPKARESLEKMKEAARGMGLQIDETENTQ